MKNIYKNQKNDARAVKISDAASMLAVSDATVRRLIEKGEIKAVRALRHYLIPLTEIERFLEV